jgi:hypothetical protein
VLVALAVLASCDRTGATACDPACEAGLVCDTDDGECIPPRIEPLEETPAGRSVRLGIIDDQTFLAAIDPAAGQVLVGTADEEPTMYALADITRPLGRKLALATSPSTVAVAWLEQDRKYRVAIHHLDDAADRWRLLPPVNSGSQAGSQDYRGSEHFDLTIDTTGRIHLAFHDAQARSLNVLSGQADAGPWTMAVVDDPSEQADLAACSEQRRRLSGQGLGYYPDVVTSAGSTFIAYHDKDCGDLRLASRVDGAWTTTVVDTGDFEREDDLELTSGITGKFPSLGIDRSGNLAIAYQDDTRGQLLLAYSREGQFTIEVADPGFEVDEFGRKRKHLVGGFASLVFDDRDIPWIAYIDATTARLRLAHRRRTLDLDGTWAQQTVDGRPPTGFSASLGFSTALGLTIATEQLRPRRDGLESRLDLLREEEF